ncbi:MAG: hypothetical protein GY696_36350 [Gammaproteobacteria bacterium]|nr:hypothetical protein [Gammaproteobacteria bacterium]
MIDVWRIQSRLKTLMEGPEWHQNESYRTMPLTMLPSKKDRALWKPMLE